MERRAGVEVVDAIETARRASKHSKRSQQAQDATGVRGCHVCGFPGLGRVWRLPANRAIVSGPWLGPYGMDGKGDSPTLALEGYATTMAFAPAQPPEPVPDSWPTDSHDAPVQYRFRAMPADGGDFVLRPYVAHTLDPASHEMRLEVIAAVSHGSRDRSPFLHASLTLKAALLARLLRNRLYV